MPTPLKVIMGGLVADIAVVLILFSAGAKDAAWVIAYLGTFVWMLGGLGFAVFFDSKKRWPGVSAFQRYARIITFYRD